MNPSVANKKPGRYIGRSVLFGLLMEILIGGTLVYFKVNDPVVWNIFFAPVAVGLWLDSGECSGSWICVPVFGILFGLILTWILYSLIVYLGFRVAELIRS